jgi:multidrug transporter EmrE-like cation transporter
MGIIFGGETLTWKKGISTILTIAGIITLTV